MCGPDVVLSTALPGLELIGRGKVRDLYRLGDQLLFVATDRISAFDCVLASGIPCKGVVLSQTSRFWFERLSALIPSHLITADAGAFPPALAPHRHVLAGRSMLVRRADMIPIECVARGYLAGSGWKDYQRSQAVCGIPLPPGLTESAPLPEPIFTPATKAAAGHDENISFEQVCHSLGHSLASRLRDLTLELYRSAAAYARERGLILADTKFEFGFLDGQLILADEALTPDSSRYWPAENYRPGVPQPSFDKQFVRDYLEQSGWNKQPPAPPLPDDIVQRTAEKYREAYRLLTGECL